MTQRLHQKILIALLISQLGVAPAAFAAHPNPGAIAAEGQGDVGLEQLEAKKSELKRLALGYLDSARAEGWEFRNEKREPIGTADALGLLGMGQPLYGVTP